jgi:rhodanese-related sulfurtransferase
MAVKNIEAKTLKKWLDKNEAIIVDVREPAENKAECIKQARLISLGEIKKDKLPDINGKKLVIHCLSGKRASSACEKLLKEDPSLEIYNLEGGINAWKESGFKVESSGKFFLPLDRQVQLTIGLSVLIGSILAYFVNPYFNFLTGFFGLGLTFAGLTGFCGLAMLMAKMPWNKVK